LQWQLRNERVRPLASIKLCPFSKPANQFGWIILAKDTDLGEIGLGRLLSMAMLAVLDPFWSLALPNATLNSRRKGGLNVVFEEIVGAMGILRVLHNFATGEITADRSIGETQLHHLVVIAHGDIDLSKALERPILNGCEVHVRHLHCGKLKNERTSGE
jgi:hypothetical protein